jgi:hypothetical protein
VQVLIFWNAGVLRGKSAMHFGGGIDGVKHRIKTRDQTVAKALD